MTGKPAGLNPFRLPPIRLRVGVSGHREAPKLPGEAIAAVRTAVDHVLTAMTDAARPHADRPALLDGRSGRQSAGSAPDAAHYAVISSLAEGADRIVAEAGLAAGFSLEAVLPFAKGEYIKDFPTAGSRADFDALLDRAASVFALDGDANERPRGYEAAGFVMLANIDLLIAIWDGNEADGVGGTGQIVSRAISDGVPVVWIDPGNPERLQLSWAAGEERAPASANARPKVTFRAAISTSIAREITEVLFPTLQAEEQASLQQYLGERERRWSLCPWYPLLLCVFAGSPLRWADFRLPSFGHARAEWDHYFTVLPKDRAQRPAIETVLLPAYSAANHLSVYYSRIYRSAYVFNFVFAAVAVGLALGGIFIHEPTEKSYLVLAELVVIVAILSTWLSGHRWQWHRRWLDYRRLAEYLRHIRILAPIGSGGPVDRPGRRLLVDEQDWVKWYAWSLRRLLPLPDCTVDAAYMTAVRDAVRSGEIAGQVRYHAANGDRMAKLDHRIQASGEMLFGLTGALCLVFLCLVWFGAMQHVDGPYTQHILGAFTLITALLPTLGAALSAIRFQGDFQTVAAQSNRTALRLAEIDRILVVEPPIFARLTDRVEKVSDIMMADLLEWQTIFRARPLSLPA